MEKELKDIIIGTDPEDLFDLITADCSELAKYEVLFGGDVRKLYLEELNKLYGIIITRCRYALPEYYKKEVENIFIPDHIEYLPNTIGKKSVTADKMD